MASASRGYVPYQGTPLARLSPASPPLFTRPPLVPRDMVGMTGGLAASRDSRPEWRATSICEGRFLVRRARGVPHVSPTGTAAERNQTRRR